MQDHHSIHPHEQLDHYAHLWDVRDEKEREMLKVVALQYGLDPLTREVMILDDKIYITAAGLQKIALRDPEYDGCEVDIIQAEWEKAFFVIKARVWKKSCAHPFEDYGDADPSTSKLKGHSLFRHAITRARARAMRSAFAIPFCAIEELDDEQRQQLFSKRQHDARKTKGENEAPPLSTHKQQEMLRYLTQSLGYAQAMFRAEMDRRFHCTSLEQLTRQQASLLIQELNERLELREADAQEKAATQEKESTAVPAHLALETTPLPTAAQEETTAAQEETTAAQEETTAAQEETTAAQEETTAAQEIVTKAQEPPLASPEAHDDTTHEATEASEEKGAEVVVLKATPEQMDAANKLLRKMQKARGIKELKQLWGEFQELRPYLPAEIVKRISETKDQRKAILDG
jgi:hypothetical protein